MDLGLFHETEHFNSDTSYHPFANSKAHDSCSFSAIGASPVIFVIFIKNLTDSYFQSFLLFFESITFFTFWKTFVFCGQIYIPRFLFIKSHSISPSCLSFLYLHWLFSLVFCVFKKKQTYVFVYTYISFIYIYTYQLIYIYIYIHISSYAKNSTLYLI